MSSHTTKEVGPIYVLGGGPLACRYLQELSEAQSAGELSYSKLHFVDPSSEPPALEKFGEKAHFIENTYTAFLEEMIKAHQGSGLEAGLLIPDHSAPHVLFQVFLDLIRQHEIYRDRIIRITPFPDPNHPSGEFPKTPFLKTFDSGICAVSYANWVCPVECEEPNICPAIKDPRTWNFNETFAHYTKDHHTDPTLSVHLFSCLQLVRGVAFIPMDHIFHEWNRLVHKMEHEKKVNLFVATFSKCHGIIGTARIEK